MRFNAIFVIKAFYITFKASFGIVFDFYGILNYTSPATYMLYAYYYNQTQTRAFVHFFVCVVKSYAYIILFISF